MFGLEKLIAEKVAEIDAKRTAEHARMIAVLEEIRDAVRDVNETLRDGITVYQPR